MAKDEKDAAIRKRQQIAKTNRTMFISVAAAAALVGVAAVLLTFLIQEMMFNAKVIGVQDQSIKSLKTSITNSQELENRMKDLQTDENLLSARAKDEDNALRVVLDALPASDNNSAALGASLSDKLLNVPGVTIESINMEAVEGGGVAEPTESSDETTGNTPLPIDFSFTVSSTDPNNILTVVKNLERSIRTIKVVNFKVEQSQDLLTLTVSAQAFYLPEANITLRDKTVKSKEDDSSKTSDSEDAAGGAQ